MKFSDLDLRELLEFNDGLIRFAGERSLILSVNVMGLLRKELIHMLGHQTTKGIFLRMGFAHGWTTAERIKNDLPWDSEDEWRRAGGRIHALKGHVKVEIPAWREDQPEPFAWSVWQDSYEADVHLQHLGEASEPVCWNLTGFAGGYLSYVTGRRVIAREERCRGKGDADCFLVARFEQDWNGEVDDIVELLANPCLESGLNSITETLRKLDQQIEVKARRMRRPYVSEHIIARSTEMGRVLDLAKRVAKVDSIVLVGGESGVGKERVANLIHEKSARQSGPFLAVNCGAVSENLLESELFGHVRGAFTGASQDRAGLFEAARGGTLFLDEVGELPHPMQVKLLRVIQEREVRRVGENRARSVDVRLLAATHRDLKEEVEAGRFRQDLYYRLKVIEIRIPPLRDRKDDILPLARHFLEKLAQRFGRQEITGFSPEAADTLLRYAWPGNVRELENAVEHAMVLSEGPRVQLLDLPQDVRASGTSERPQSGPQTLAQMEKTAILAAMAANNGNQNQTARELGIGTATLYRKLKKYRDEGA